ncbi:MAG: acetyl-CoA C-acetyltransferase, partial [Alphaproteobacteria bacterium]
MTDRTAEIVIAGAARTPMGAFQGELAPLAAPELGGAAIAGAIGNAGVDAAAVAEGSRGCVLPAGVGQAPARQAGFAAGLGEEVPASTLNKVCGSGMKTVMMAHDLVRAGSA